MPELTPQQKAKLDKNIKAMLSQGASEQDVISYATDFRARFDVKKKVSIADVGMAARGGGEVGVSKAPSGLTVTGYETDLDRSIQERQRQATQINLDENDPIKSDLLPIENKIAERRNRQVSSSTATPISRLSESFANKELASEKSVIENSRFRDVKEAELFLFDKLDKSKLVPKQPLDITKEPTLDDFTEESVVEASPKDNLTVQKAASQYFTNKEIKEDIGSSASLDEAAIKNAIRKGDVTSKQITELGGDIPNQMKGLLVLNFLNNPDVREEANKNPELMNQVRQELFDLPEKYPLAAIRMMAEMVSKEMEQRGDNNAILNIKSKNSTDDILNELVERGDLPVQYKYLYDNPAVKLAVNSSLKTSGFVENLLSGAEQGLMGIGKTVAEVTGLRSAYSDKNERTFKALEKQYSDFAFKPKGWVHEISTHGGLVTGQVSSMMAGGGLIKAAGLVNSTKAANAIMAGLQTFGENKDRALVDLPGESGAKQLGYATVLTGVEIALANVLDDTKLAKSLIKGVSPEIKTVVTKFANKEITAAAAKKSVIDLFSNVLSKSGTFVKGTANVANKEAWEEYATAVLQTTTNQAFSGQPIELSQSAKDNFEVWRTTFLGSLFLGIGGGVVDVNKNPSMPKLIYEMAENPDKYIDIIEGQAAIDENYSKDVKQKIANLEYISKVKQDLDGTEMSKKDKEKFLLASLNQKILSDQAESITEPTLKKKPEEKIKELEAVKQDILENPTKEEISQPIELDPNLPEGYALPNQPTIDQDRVLGDEDVELTPEQKILQQAIDNNEIVGIYLDIAKASVNDPKEAKLLLDDAKSQIEGQVAGNIGTAREGVEKAFGKSIVDFVLPKAEAGSVGVVDVKLEKPSAEQQLKDIQEGNMVTFEYKNESEVPEVFKDKISSKGEVNGKTYVKVTMAKSLADYHLQEQSLKEQPKADKGIKSSWERNIEALINPETGLAATIRKMDIGQKEKDAFLKRIGLTKEAYDKLDVEGKQKIQDQWVKSKEFEELSNKKEQPKAGSGGVVDVLKDVESTAKITGEQVRMKLQEIEKEPIRINITQDENGKMEQSSQEIIESIKSELDKTGLPYSDVVSNEKGSTYYVVTKDGQQHEILKVLQSGGALLPSNLRKAKWINHLIKTERDYVVKAVEQSLKEQPKAETPTQEASTGLSRGDVEDAREINVLSMLKESKILTPIEKQTLWQQYKRGVMNDTDVAKYTNVNVEDIQSGDVNKWAKVVLDKIKGKEIKAEEIDFEELPQAQSLSSNTPSQAQPKAGSGGVEGDVPQFAAKSEKHFEYVPIEEVDAYKEFDRETDKKFDKKELDDLTEDIRKNGIKNPIQIKVDSNGKALIVEGNTRLAAAKRLGIKNIPVEIIDGEFGSINKNKAKSLPDVGRSELQRRQQNELGLKDNNGAYSKGFTRVEQSLKAEDKAPVTKPEGKSDVVVDKASNVGAAAVKPKEGHVYRAIDNADDAVGNDKSFSNKTNWYDGEGFLIEAKNAEGKNIEHHEGAKRGNIKAEDVTTVYYEPDGIATDTKTVERELVKMKDKFPNAKFIEVESIEDKNGENQLHVKAAEQSLKETPKAETPTQETTPVSDAPKIEKSELERQLKKVEHRKVVNIDELPDKIYHVTTNLDAVNESGYLKAASDLESEGMGGSESLGVSFVTDKGVAENIANELNVLSNANKVKTKEDAEAFLNTLDKKRRSVVEPEYRLRVNELNENPQDALIMGLRTSRNLSKLKGEPYNGLVIFFEKRVGVGGGKIGIVEVSKSNIRSGAKVIEGVDRDLGEIRVIDNVPINKTKELAKTPVSEPTTPPTTQPKSEGNKVDEGMVSELEAERDAEILKQGKPKVDIVGLKDEEFAKLSATKQNEYEEWEKEEINLRKLIDCLWKK